MPLSAAGEALGQPLLVGEPNTNPLKPRRAVGGPVLELLNEVGNVAQQFTLDRDPTTIGRTNADICFKDDLFMSPLHAQAGLRDGELVVRDLGSRNGTWVFIEEPYRLQDGDTILLGSQLIRFRRLGYPAPHPPEADQTRRLGSVTPSADVATLAQLRSDGSVRDILVLSPGRTVKIGRDVGDWVFPYDKTMSGKHAEIRSEDLQFIVLDDGSRNGIAVATRGEQPVNVGQRILVGDQTLRVKSL
ncbi:MAG TPA: FHA domain-containing protein [Gemmatimonadaceae bacterium]|nr:FHA domain-containing protein [Gemmatimonadaceae bacterium]